MKKRLAINLFLITFLISLTVPLSVFAINDSTVRSRTTQLSSLYHAVSIVGSNVIYYSVQFNLTFFQEIHFTCNSSNPSAHILVEIMTSGGYTQFLYNGLPEGLNPDIGSYGQGNFSGVCYYMNRQLSDAGYTFTPLGSYHYLVFEDIDTNVSTSITAEVSVVSSPSAYVFIFCIIGVPAIILIVIVVIVVIVKRHRKVLQKT